MRLPRIPRAWLRRFPRVAFARDPRTVAPGTWVFAPIRRATLHCGLAGFVEVARPAPFEAPRSADLERLARSAAGISVREVAANPSRLGGYAGGEGVPAALLALACALRRPAALDLGPALRPLEEAAAAAARGIRAFCDAEESALDEVAATLPSAAQETVASRIVALRDAAWTLQEEFLGMLARARDLAGPGAPPKLLREMRKLTSTLDSVDRIEVRGRDSAGLLVMAVFPSGASWESFHGSLAPDLAADLDRRANLPDLLDGAVCVAAPGDPARPVALSFVRKEAAEVGHLGDNVAALRARFREDALLRAALSRPETTVVVLGHTRWASSGVIHEANAHPVDNATVPAGRRGEAAAVRPQGDPHPHYGAARGRIFVALNGDVDNHVPLHDAYEGATGLRGSPRVTTDTKVIALQIDRRLREGLPLEEAFRRAVADLEGSAAVAMISDLEPGRLFLSLRGSGQSLHVGAAPDGFVISSEVYGLVHETAEFAALEGERERVPGDRASRGTVAVLDASGVPGAPRLLSFAGTDLPRETAPRRAEITTRDVDRGEFAHYYRKEIGQTPSSVARTLHGKFALEGPGGRKVRLNLGREILPESVEAGLRERKLRRIVCVGQGAAAVAGAAMAALLREDLRGAGVEVLGEKASEMSGFGLRDDMSDTLVVAVTQSGTTADTNRAVDVARRRGAKVLAVVNRRNSDITRRADGVFHTSDGRDVEMAVASTKAFHAQIAAGAVLSLAFGRILGTLDEAASAERARELQALPDRLREVLALDPRIASIARDLGPVRRHWTVVGSGLNRIAADEVRIKCSELCYKSLSADTVEDKKHIDLSSESLMLVLAAGNPPTVQSDLAKDVAIFQAHKGLPVVFADAGDARYDAMAAAVIPIPQAAPRTALFLNVLAGQLFAYHAARAIDEGARFFSGVRAALVAETLGGGRGVGGILEAAAAEATERLRAGRFESALGASQAAQAVLLLHGIGAPSTEEVLAALSGLVRELERPVDAIRHQAKTVTVGTSRTAERLAGPVFDALEEADVAMEAIPDASLLALRAVQPALAAVEGWARYRVEDLEGDGAPSEGTRIVIEARGGVSARLPSRAEGGALLKGTKRGVVAHRRPFVGIGAKDGRPLVIVPLVDARLHCTAIVLLHAKFRDALPLPEKLGVLGPHRLEEIVNGVSEADVTWSDALLEPVSPRDLVCLSAERIVDDLVARSRGKV